MTVVLIKTCSEHPEMYDVFYDRKKIGYLRLRYGYFTAQPLQNDGALGRLVYFAETKGEGSFADDERDFFLQVAVNALMDNLRRPRTDYEVWNGEG